MKIQKYLKSSPLFAINASYERCLTSINRELKKKKLNFLQGLALTAIFFEENRTVSPSALAQQLHTSPGNVSHIISHLEGLGWVKRIIHDQDSRKYLLELKPEGRKRAMELIRFFDKLQDLVEDKLGSKNSSQLAENISILSKSLDLAEISKN